MARSATVRLSLAAALGLLVAASVEFSAFVAGHILADRGLLYAPAPSDGFATYMAQRDPVLGWPSPLSIGKGEFDTSGSRIVPAFPDPNTKACVALFGDSYTWGDEVAPEDAYGNVLATRLRCRVANFGVGGYGTDQAVIRYELLKPAARVVVLGHFSVEIIRNVNQFRDFFALSSRFGFKPRFVLRDGQLELIPLPVLAEDSYRELVRHPDTVLPLDWFRPGGPAGVVELRFPFTLSVARALKDYRLARLNREPSYAEFYRPDHPSGALELTVAIMRRFVADARERDQEPLILVIPDVSDLESLLDHHTVPYQPLLDRLTLEGVPFVSAAQALAQVLHGRPPCALYFRCSRSHLRPEGNRVLALVVEKALQDRGLLGEMPR